MLQEGLKLLINAADKLWESVGFQHLRSSNLKMPVAREIKLVKSKQCPQAARGSEIDGAFGRETLTISQLASAPIPEGRIVAVEDQLTEDLIEEREEILEESGGASDETEELGDDPKEEIQEVKNSLRVLYSFNPTYTSGGFIESLNPDFRRIQGSRARKERAQAKLAARDSVLIAKVELKSGRTKLEDYKSMSRIDEPVLNLELRRFVYKPAEKSKLRNHTQ